MEQYFSKFVILFILITIFFSSCAAFGWWIGFFNLWGLFRHSFLLWGRCLVVIAIFFNFMSSIVIMFLVDYLLYLISLDCIMLQTFVLIIEILLVIFFIILATFFNFSIWVLYFLVIFFVYLMIKLILYSLVFFSIKVFHFNVVYDILDMFSF